jgi:hypothetical protein
MDFKEMVSVNMSLIHLTEYGVQMIASVNTYMYRAWDSLIY